MNINLPHSLVAVVQRRVEERGYSSAEEYVCDLILADQEPDAAWLSLSDSERESAERINALLLKSLDSGPPVVADEAFWDGMKRRIRERSSLGD